MMREAPKFALILSGCGNRDGSEIHETTMMMLAINERGCKYECFAPNIEQSETINHITGETTSKKGDKDNRNMMVEAARIARGKIKDIKELNVKDYYAVVLPGGLGAAKNLSNFAEKGADCEVNSDVARVIKEAHEAKVVIGALCIAPVIVAKVLGKNKVKLTIGNDKETAAKIEKMGAKHEECEAYDVCVDEKNKVASTPCYMLATHISEIRAATYNIMDALLDMMDLSAYEDENEGCGCGCEAHHHHDDHECQCGGSCGCDHHH